MNRWLFSHGPLVRSVRLARSILLLFAGIASAQAATPSRIPSPGHIFSVRYKPGLVSFLDFRGRVLFADDYAKRDYHAERGRWSRSGRFHVYSLYSQGGHRPWHRPLVVADLRMGRCYTDADLGEGDSVSGFRLSGDDSISYHVLDRTKDNWDAGVPGISRRFSLARKIGRLKPTK